MIFPVSSFFLPLSQGQHSHLAVHSLSVGSEPPNPLVFLSAFPTCCCSAPPSLPVPIFPSGINCSTSSKHCSGMKSTLVVPWAPSASTGEGLEMQGRAQTAILYLRSLSQRLAFPLLSSATLEYFCGDEEPKESPSPGRDCVPG